MEDLVGCIFRVEHDTWEGKEGEARIWCERDGLVSGRDRHGLDPARRRMWGRGTLSQTCAWLEDGVLPDTSAIVVVR